MKDKSRIRKFSNNKDNLVDFIRGGYTILGNINFPKGAVDFIENYNSQEMRVYFLRAETGTRSLRDENGPFVSDSMLSYFDSGMINKEAIVHALKNLNSIPEKSYLVADESKNQSLVLEGKNVVPSHSANESPYSAIIIEGSKTKSKLLEDSVSGRAYDPHTLLRRIVSKKVWKDFENEKGDSKWFEEKYKPKFREK